MMRFLKIVPVPRVVLSQLGYDTALYGTIALGVFDVHGADY